MTCTVRRYAKSATKTNSMTEPNIMGGAYQQDVQNVYNASIVATSILVIVFMANPSSRFLINLAHRNYIDDHTCMRISYPKTAIVTITESMNSCKM